MPQQRNAKAACGSCRVRKVRCVGGQPCTQCNHLNLVCRYEEAAQEGRSKRSIKRGGLIARCKTNDVADADAEDGEGEGKVDGSERRHPLSPTQAQRDFWLSLLPQYERAVYPVNPVITGEEVREAVAAVAAGAGEAEDHHLLPTRVAFLHAFAAVTLTVTVQWTEGDGTWLRICESVRGCLSVLRGQEEVVEGELLLLPGNGATAPAARRAPDILSVVTLVFVEVVMMSLRRMEQAFLYLRRAIALMQTLRVHEPGGWGRGVGPRERTRRVFLYWEIFVHERFLAIAVQYPAVLPPFPGGMPGAELLVPEQVSVGFGRIIKLFSLVDEEFLGQWLGSARDRVGAEWIAERQRLLDEDEDEADHAAQSLAGMSEAGSGPGKDLSAEAVGLSNLQHADLFVTRLWLRTVVWQLAMSRCLLSSSETAPEALSLAFPVRRVLRQLKEIVEPSANGVDMKENIALHGSGMLQKLFEITTTVADVLALVPGTAADGSGDGNGINDFCMLLKTLLGFKRVEKMQRDILWMKVDALRRVFPSFDFSVIAPA